MSGSAQEDGYQGQASPATPWNEYNSLAFVINQIVNQKWTVAVVKVMKVEGGGLSGPPTVDVQPMVNQMNGRGEPTEHGTIYKIPVFRVQGGDIGAIVSDPVVGDVGLMAVSMRDISTVVRTKAVANPGSARTYDPADGVYLGAILGKEPKQYVQFSTDGVKIIDKNGNTIDMKNGGITITPASGQKVTVQSDLVVNGNLVAQNNLQLGGLIEGHDGGEYAGNIVTSGMVQGKTQVFAGGGAGGAGGVGLSSHTHTQPPDSHGDTEAPTSTGTG